MKQSLNFLKKIIEKWGKNVLPAAARSTFSKRQHFREQRKDKGTATDATRSHPSLQGHAPNQRWRHTFSPTSPRGMEKARNRQRKVWVSKNENVLAAAARSTFLKNTHLKQRRIIKQSVKNSSKKRHEIIHKALTKHKKSWTNHKTIIKKS